MRILVTGAAGMLGTSLTPVLEARDHTIRKTDIRFVEADMGYLDVRETEHMMEVSREFKPDILVHLAAETDLEKCETDSDYAYGENFIGTQNACMVCRDLGIPIAYVSTAGVFDGSKDSPYTEFDVPNPINVYGMSKYQGEQVVRATVSDHYIVRAGWMIGGGARDKKFVHKIVEQIDAGAKKIFAVDDKFGTPTYAPAFSRVFEKIIGTRRYGTYHLACKGLATRHDVAREILRVTGRRDIELVAVKSDFFKKDFFAPRPRSEEMRNYMLDLISMNDMPHWETALETYLTEFFHDRIR